MANVNKKTQQPAGDSLFNRADRIIIAVGLIVIVLGFYALAQMPVYGFVTMYVAPTLLVAGFLVIIPVGILRGGNKRNDFAHKENGGD